MKSFKEFLMEEDEQNNDVQNLKILNDLKDFFNNFNEEEKDKDIDQEIIVKYLICKSIIKTNKDGEDTFGLKIEDSNKYLQELKEECRKFLTINSEASANSVLAKKIKSINEYILGKYEKQKLGSLLLNKGDIVIDQNMSFASFINQAEEKINEKLKEAGHVPTPPNDIAKGSGNDDNTPPTNGGNTPPTNGGNTPPTNGGNGGNNENYDTTRQGSYLGRFTSAQMEDIMSGNEDKIANALGVMAKAAKDRCDELLRQVKEKVEKNSKYLEEEEVAQKVLWEGIFNRLPKQEKLKIQKQHGTKSIYKDEDNQKLTEIINNYKDQIDKLVDTTVSNCLPLGEKLHAFNTSAKMESKLKEQLRMNARNFINKMYDITLEVEKASRKSGFFENKKIEKGSKKEEEWNNFKNSEKGENFDRQLNEKTIALKKELSKILPNVQKVSSEADMNVKLVSKLIKDSSDAKDFLKKASLKKVYENGKSIFILDWLYKKGIPVPLRTAISDKYSKNLTIVSWNELFKDKEFLNSLNGYGESWENFKIAYGNLRTLEDFKRFKEQYGKDFEVEINILCKKFIEQEKQQQNQQNQDRQNPKPTDKLDSKGFPTPNNDDVDGDDIAANAQSSVTTNSCDGLPIGARKYSKAARRRMNYALNKYL